MSLTLIIGWLFLLASWFPKPFIKNERTRYYTNLFLACAALGVFISGGISLLNK